MTVIILTSGTSWSVPSDWSNTNQVETWGGGGGGGSSSTQPGSGGGSGGYSSSSNIAGLSGSITISIGTGGADNTAGGATWFNGASLAASTVGSNGGGAGFNNGSTSVGQGASTTGATGTTKTAGANGGQVNTTSDDGGGGGGAPGPQGAGAVGGNSPSSGVAAAGGAGDNGSGGAGGTGGTGTTGNGGNGGANSNGGGGGGAGNGAGTTSNGGTGGLPGGGGGGAGIGGTGVETGGGGQIRITYTPNTGSSNSLLSTTLPEGRKPWKADQWGLHNYQGIQRMPLAPNTVMGYIWNAVPPGPFNLSFYQDWKLAPQGAPTNRPSLVYDVPATTWETRGHLIDSEGWRQGPRPAEYLVPLPRTEVPAGVYNIFAYQSVQAGPQPLGIQPGVTGTTWSLPITGDPRNSYNGVQIGPRPATTQVPPILPVTFVPPGSWSIASYQWHTTGYQRAEYQAPLPVADVPKGRVLYDYSGWTYLQPPIQGPVPIQSSRSTDLPVTSALANRSNSFSGAQGSPQPPAMIPSATVCWLPLVYVGNTPIPGGNGVIDVRHGDTVHSVPPVGPNLFNYTGVQVSPPLIDNANAFTSFATDVPRGTTNDPRWNYRGTQAAPVRPDNTVAFSNRSTTVPVGVKDNLGWRYNGTQQPPQTAPSLLSSGSMSFSVPPQIKDDNRRDYKGWSAQPNTGLPPNLLNVFLAMYVDSLTFMGRSTTVPIGNRDNPRWVYRGTQAAPQSAISVMSFTRSTTQVPDSVVYNRRFMFGGAQSGPVRPTAVFLAGPMIMSPPMQPPPPVFNVPLPAPRSFAYMGGGRGPSRWE